MKNENHTFKDLLFKAGFMNFGKLKRKEICEFLHITERTLDRWISKNNACPRAVHMLKNKICGSVSLNKKWDGFFICRDGYLWTPRGLRLEPEYLDKIDFLQRSNQLNQNNAEDLMKELEHIDRLKEESKLIKVIGTELINLSDKLKSKKAISEIQKRTGLRSMTPSLSVVNR